MKIGWPQLTFTPDSDALDALSNGWGEVIGEPYTPLLFSVLGDVFYQAASGVYWLNTGACETTHVADTVAQFQSHLATELADEWFLPPLVEQLYAAGKIPKPGYCYTPVILPVFVEGKYTVSNLNPVPGKEHFALTAEVHSQIRSLPNGTSVRLSVGE
ncbi:hypothetical protein B0E47_08355 [Rhodanobacter sp. B05]|uniref:T6SS immunity protein Tdi1 domain-containing protein n=1 Tax=Rhodanobacter sp. B05 TaxID=1945859 RepID=UPI0009865C67|nr:T6SS immunity protein Tdi1 domain-containing protein [Rhodanobacter sp. B05]OOG55861.1 hypothetical protein B0E47_08355 [Rhodanobacter sp. B05]